MKKDNNTIEVVEEQKQCPYFDNKKSDTRYKYIEKCSIEEYSKMCERGWRRFGNMFFIPECSTCNDCTTIRIDIKKFEFSKSQRRVLNKNANIKAYIQSPSISLDHINLFDKYHSYMHEKKGWSYEPTTPDSYHQSYVSGAYDYGKELLYFIDDKLVGVALLDVCEDSISSVYCYYDHDYQELSLGKFSILTQISLAKQMKIPYLYLGYWIKDHYSMGYKEDYKPFEVLVNRPTLDEKTIWRDYE